MKLTLIALYISMIAFINLLPTIDLNLTDEQYNRFKDYVFGIDIGLLVGFVFNDLLNSDFINKKK